MTGSTMAGLTERAALSRALFAPDSIAFIGGSGDESKYTSLPQRYLRKHGFRRDLPGQSQPDRNLRRARLCIDQSRSTTRRSCLHHAAGQDGT